MVQTRAWLTKFPARQRLVAELRSAHAPRVGLEILYRRSAPSGKRSSGSADDCGISRLMCPWQNTHQQVKAKILERMAEWTEMFARDPDLGIMEQQYMKLKSQSEYLGKFSRHATDRPDPNLQPPSKPNKQEITSVDRQKEEEELQMALALSIKDKTSAVTSRPGQASTGPSAGHGAAAAPSQSVPSGTTAATVSRVRALYDFQPSEPGELQFRKGDIIAVLESVYKDWWKGADGWKDPIPFHLGHPTQTDRTDRKVFTEKG